MRHAVLSACHAGSLTVSPCVPSQWRTTASAIGTPSARVPVGEVAQPGEAVEIIGEGRRDVQRREIELTQRQFQSAMQEVPRPDSSEDSRVGKEGVSTVELRWSPVLSKKKT